MTNKIFHEYRMPVLHKVFMFSSVLLLASIVWTVVDDYNRPWKQYQRAFRKLDIAKTEADLALPLPPKEQKELERVEAELVVRRQELDAQAAAMKAAHASSLAQSDLIGRLEPVFKSMKGELDALRYRVDKATADGDQKALEKWRRDFDELDKKLVEQRNQLDEARAAKAAADAEVARLEGPVKELETEHDKLLKQQKLLTEKKVRLTRGTGEEKVKQFIQDAPLIDFIKPNYKIEQVVLPRLKDDYNFVLVDKVDRCMTCHLAIDKKGYEDPEKFPQPFRTHPNLDLYVYSSAKHNLAEFGCTTCHSGSGQDTTFQDTHHTPDNYPQQAEWEKKHDWERSHFWDLPMLAKSHVEASCYACHATQAWVPGADKLNRGMELMRDYGCWGCHKVAAIEDRRAEGVLRKVGPDLTRIATKVDEDWMRKWILNPKGFMPATKMPNFFHINEGATDSHADFAEHVYDNRDTDEHRDLIDAEVEGLATFLLSRSETGAWPEAPPLDGDVARGKALFEEVGCMGCHTVGAQSRKDRKVDFGPDLGASGSKLDPNWLFAWLKDPKSYWHETSMPSLRLTDQEAIDLSAYLLSLRNPAFEKAPVPAAKDAALDALTADLLRVQLPPTALQARMAGMSRNDKLMLVGERMLNRYGCFGCHNIKGYENAQGIGTELSQYANKDITRLDAGFVDPKAFLAEMHGDAKLAEEIRHATHGHAQLDLGNYIRVKILNPRKYDEGRLRNRDEKLKMPYFGFTDEEADAIVTAVLGLRNDNVVAERKYAADPQIERGRWLVRRYNCLGCHVVEGRGGDIRKAMKDLGKKPYMYPPNLATIGAKLQPEWFYAFLGEPSMVRPWVKVRMPSFHLSDSDMNAIITYFNRVDKQDFPFHAPVGKQDQVQVASGMEMFNKVQCGLCHPRSEADIAKINPESLAPNLGLARTRLKGDWIKRWITAPQSIVPDTRMPTFFAKDKQGKLVSPAPTIMGGDAEVQIEALKEYVLSIGAEN